MQNWEVTIVSRKTKAPAASAVAAGLPTIHSLHMSFSCEGLSSPAVMESLDEAEGQQGQLSRKEQSPKTSQKTAPLGLAARWNGLMPRDSMYLFVFSQILVRQLSLLGNAGTLLLSFVGLGGFLLVHCRCSNGRSCSLTSAAPSHSFALQTAPVLWCPRLPSWSLPLCQGLLFQMTRLPTNPLM